MNKIAIYGAGGLGKEVKVIIDAINAQQSGREYDFIGYFDDHRSAPDVIGGLTELNQWSDPMQLVLAIGNPSIKVGLAEQISNIHVSYATLIHPRAEIGNDKHVRIGEGSIIASGAQLTTDIVIGRHVLINLNVTVGHDSSILDFSSIMPGANISGQVLVRKASLIGAGANVLNGIVVGENATVGAGAVVVKDVENATTVVGVPAKVIK